MIRICVCLLLVTAVLSYGNAYHLTGGGRVRRQIFGGRAPTPGGGFSTSLGYAGSLYRNNNNDVSASGFLSQTQDRGGRLSPLMLGGETTWTRPRSSLSLSGVHALGGNTQVGLSGRVDILKQPDHTVSVFGSHSKTFDPSFREIGSGSTTAGVGYEHKSGGGLSFSGTRTPGAPDIGVIAGQLPLYRSNDGTAKLDLTGQVNLMEGQKPQKQIGITFEKKF